MTPARDSWRTPRRLTPVANSCRYITRGKKGGGGSVIERGRGGGKSGEVEGHSGRRGRGLLGGWERGSFGGGWRGHWEGTGVGGGVIYRGQGKGG